MSNSNKKIHTIEVAEWSKLLWKELFKIIYQELMLIVVDLWLVRLAMFMSKKSGLINLPKKEDGEEDMLDMAYEPK